MISLQGIWATGALESMAAPGPRSGVLSTAWAEYLDRPKPRVNEIVAPESVTEKLLRWMESLSPSSVRVNKPLSTAEAWNELEELAERLRARAPEETEVLAGVLRAIRQRLIGEPLEDPEVVAGEIRAEMERGTLRRYPRQRSVADDERIGPEEFLRLEYSRYLICAGAERDRIYQKQLREADPRLWNALSKKLGGGLRELVPALKDWTDLRLQVASLDQILTDPSLASAALRRARKSAGRI